MPKTSGAPPPLNLTLTKRDNVQAAPLSPVIVSSHSTNSPMTPQSGPGSPVPQYVTVNQSARNHMDVSRGLNSPTSPRITAIPEFLPSPDRPRHAREPSRSFFANFKASKSSHKLQTSEAGMWEAGDRNGTGRSRASSRDRSLSSVKKQGSTPELPRLLANNAKTTHAEQDEAASVPLPPGSSEGNAVTQKKSRSKLGGILGRNKTPKLEDDRRQWQRPDVQLNVDTRLSQDAAVDPSHAPLKTAPIKADYRERAFAIETDSRNRARSVDRNPEPPVSRNAGTASQLATSSLPKENPSLFSNIQQTGKGVGHSLGKAGKGFFSKMTRSSSTNEREVLVEENYVCTTINLPLVEQTRKTRIAKKLELSRDKTEFWMPALPWRCIDYLNMNGCEEEGLYRIPGSGREVKVWQKRFDTQYDINLFEQTDLYDINTIGSMFKSWLRDLPDEILPKATQNKIARECAGATTTPQLLKDELSKLPPFNYYLLFAITCHLSLLHSFADKNKMDYRNLCICFQPCLKIDGFCFQFLVINWKECWQGCWTEHEYLQEEYRWEREGSVRSAMSAPLDDRAISSSGSSHIMSQTQHSARSTENMIHHKNSTPQLRQKSRSQSNGGQGSTRNVIGHNNSSSLPSVPMPPRLVTASSTPEQRAAPSEQLPELSNLSPIRM